MSGIMANKKLTIFPVDYYSCLAWAWKRHQRRYSAEDVRRLVDAAVGDGGADIILWRVSSCGAVTYRSNIENHFSRTDPRVYARVAAAAMDEYDPPREGLKAAHRAGVPLYAWVTLFDDAYLWSNSRFLEKNPYCRWVDRSGLIHLNGVPCYDYQEAIDFRLAMIRELLAYGVNGLYLSMRSHCNQVCPYPQKDMFGFNDPVVAEYKQRYGIDLRKIEDCRDSHNADHFAHQVQYDGPEFDVDAWHRLKGESLTRLLREIRALVGPDFPVWMCLLGPYDGMNLDRTAAACPDLSEGIHRFARLHTNWPRWLEERLVNDLVLCTRGGLPPESGVMPFEQQTHQLGGRLHWFAHLGGQRTPWGRIGELRERIDSLPIDGVMPYEAANFEMLPEDKA